MDGRADFQKSDVFIMSGRIVEHVMLPPAKRVAG
jgi:hypothetical protein